MMTILKRPRIWPFFLLILCNLGWGQSLQLSYVSPETKLELDHDFQAARWPLDATLPEKWTCELIGVRSGLQHEHDLPLYHFTHREKAKITNSGAGPVKEFTAGIRKDEWVGQTGTVEDQVRRINAKTLISRISQVKTKTVLAYARCTST